ncbi:hypothetical protein MJN51_39090, partial [Salmonella enterica subsp. enterica serovar Kentucky]|nr:hypothetical protein [Salmonella enterica subsp. enterica serovar Kentucky]
SGTFTGTSPTENPVNKSSGVDEMISLSEATWHSVSVDEEYYARQGSSKQIANR